MSVFDDIDRSEYDPAAYSEPDFAYLNRTARPDFARVRAMIEEWFARYPAPHQKDLLPRLRSCRRAVFAGAFFELYIHELLLRLEYQIEIHPSNPSGAGTRPDFFAQRCGGDGIYVEATVAGDRSDAKSAAQARITRAYDTVNRLDSPDFYLHLEDAGLPATPVPKRFREEVERFLTRQDYDRCLQLFDAGGLSALPSARFEHDGWIVTYSAIPKRSGKGRPGDRPIAITGPAAVYRLDNVSALRAAIRRKAGKYGKLGSPLVIAVNAATQRLTDRWIMEALFGSECMIVRGQVSKPSRVPDGILIGARGPVHQRVSALLVVSSLDPWSVATQPLRVYHHPWAHRPCLNEFVKLPQAVPSDDRMDFRDSIAPHEIFGLPEGWPAAADDIGPDATAY